MHADGHLLQIEDDVGDVLDHPGDGGELVQHTLDLHRRHCGPLDRGEQDPAHGVTDGGGEAALERLRDEAAVARRQRLGVHLDPLRALETLPHRCELLKG